MENIEHDALFEIRIELKVWIECLSEKDLDRLMWLVHDEQKARKMSVSRINNNKKGEIIE